MANPTEVEISKAVRNLVAEATGISGANVIPQDDNHPAPNTLYATVKEITTIGEGIDGEVARENAADPLKVDLERKGNRVGVFSVQFYRDGAGDAARDLLDYPSGSVAQIWMMENGITWKRSGDIRDIAAVMGSKNEPRKAIDIEIKYQSDNTDIVNKLGSAEIEFNLTAETDYTDTLEVTE